MKSWEKEEIATLPEKYVPLGAWTMLLYRSCSVFRSLGGFILSIAHAVRAASRGAALRGIGSFFISLSSLWLRSWFRPSWRRWGSFDFFVFLSVNLYIFAKTVCLYDGDAVFLYVFIDFFHMGMV